MRWYTWKSTIELSENEVEWDIKKDTVDFLEKQALDYISLVYLLLCPLKNDQQI